MNEDEGHLVAESAADFDGWEILYVRNWKPGVKQVFCRKVDPGGQGHFMMVYAKEEFVPKP